MGARAATRMFGAASAERRNSLNSKRSRGSDNPMRDSLQRAEDRDLLGTGNMLVRARKRMTFFFKAVVASIPLPFKRKSLDGTPHRRASLQSVQSIETILPSGNPMLLRGSTGCGGRSSSERLGSRD